VTILIRTGAAAPCLLCVCLCACSGSGAGLDSSGQPLSGSSSGGSVPLSADFDSIQANVFTPICSVCHIGATAPEGLMLDAAHSFNLLVNVPSTEEPGTLRVKPGDPTNSYIIQKLEGHAAVGGQMPLGQPPLPSATINFIAQWIMNGAQQGASAGTMAASFRVAATAPEDGAVLALAPSRVILGFSRDLDSTRADSSSVRLERIDASADSSAGSALVPTEISVPAANPRTLMLTPRAPLKTGQYQVVLSGQPGNVLSSIDGARLDRSAAASSTDQIVSRFAVTPTP
jgi:methionine-rich copper-binding protein CopC